MPLYGTTVRAICPIRKELITFAGPNIQAFTSKLAHEYCQTNGLGYCEVGDEIVMEIPCKKGTYEPDFDNAIDYDAQNNN